MFTIHEFDNTITVHSIGAPPNGTSHLVAQPLSIAPNDAQVPKGATFAAAEILIPPPGNGNLLYASNRNTAVNATDPRGDSIAIVQFNPPGRNSAASLKIVKQVFTGLQQIRSMAFSDDGNFLVAGAALTGGVKVFEMADGGTDLREVAANTEVDTRTSFVWV